MESLYWSKRLGIVMVMAYGAWMLYANVNRLVPVLGANLGRHEESRPEKLGGTALEQRLVESNAFGKAALARMLWCSRQSDGWNPLNSWDYICQIGGGIDGKTHQAIPGGMKFGLLADSQHITGISDLYPAEDGIPAFAKATTLSPDEPAREELTCGGPHFTATYFPATKFFGPALNVTFRPQGASFRTTTDQSEAINAAVRTCIQSIGRSKTLVQELPATAWVQQYHEAKSLSPLLGRAEHLVFDPQTKQVRIWTKRNGLMPPEPSE